VPTLRESNKAKRRDEILAAAGRIIAAEGIDALSMRKLASAAEVSVATVYNLLGGKDDVLFALVETGMDRMDEALARIPLDDPLARAQAVVTVSAEYFADNADVFRPVCLAHRRRETENTRARALAERAADMQRVALHAAASAGLLLDELDLDTLGAEIFSGWDVAATQWALGRVSAAGFKARALYSLYICLLAVATPATRAVLLDRLHEVEPLAKQRLRKRNTGQAA
jgi:AcrR family transcriptional regulator